MARPPSNRPTPGEIEILHVFWRRGRMTVQQVHDELNLKRASAISTVATLIRLMVNKGYVRKHDDDPRRHEFEAIITEDEAGRSAVADVRERLFGGSLRALVSHAFKGKKPSAAELDELRKIVDDAKKSESKKPT